MNIDIENYNQKHGVSIHKNRETITYYYNEFIIHHISNQDMCIRNYIGLKPFGIILLKLVTKYV